MGREDPPLKAGVRPRQISGEWYAPKSDPSCPVCQSPYRRTIEEKCLRKRDPAEICKNLPEDNQVLPRHIGKHLERGHLLVDASTRARYEMADEITPRLTSQQWMLVVDEVMWTLRNLPPGALDQGTDIAGVVLGAIKQEPILGRWARLYATDDGRSD